MKKISIFLLLAVFTIGLACASEAAAPLKAIISRDDPAGRQGFARFRFVNAIPDSPPLDLWLMPESKIANVPYGGVSPFVDLANGTLPATHLTVVQSGTTGPVLAEIEPPCYSDCDATLVAAGSMNSPLVWSLFGVVGTPPPGQALVRFLDVSPDMPVAVVRLAGGPALDSYFEFAEATVYMPVPAGTNDVEFVEMGTNTVALTVPVSLAEGGAYTVYLMGLRAETGVPSNPVRVWVPAAAHTAGLNQTQWRSDLGLLNPGTATATVQIQFFGSGSVVGNTTSVPAGTQTILTDVVGQLGADGQGALEIVADQPLKVTSRTYNQSAPDAVCFPNGTQGQSFPVLAAGGGLGAGQSAYLPGLVQNADYRSNIGLVNTDEGPATVLVELFDGAGTKLAQYTVGLAHGQWAQENRPFEKKAGLTAMDRGYAKVTVQAGSGVYAFATVIDNVTNDPTTVAMQR
ncbi:MAG TPA: DUF4397 domain-containing protein [Thermoanaerobaculaceae bacterium]|nr:DUF4397 domain-containing protein [Thermoanaerobaculaceae bacterium]